MNHQPEPARLSEDEKISLLGGDTFWTTVELPGIASMLMTDGPHGLRLQRDDQAGDHLGLGEAIKATCFPTAAALAQTWDTELVGGVGRALAAECRAAGVHVLLGPGVNIKRDPRGGRNFEYYSEDPVLAGDLAAAWVAGLQERGVGASLKHFALNNQERDRMRISADVDQRPLREIYLRAFERVVKRARPWTVMCSYNRVNGVHASQNGWLLTELLRGEWGFDGVVVSDWGAVADRVAALEAGLDLAMPADGGVGAAELRAALASRAPVGRLIDQSVERLRRLSERTGAAAKSDRAQDPVWSVEAHHAFARQVAARAVVLLKNEGAALPLGPADKIAVIGAFARQPRYQGGGSSHVNATRVDLPLDEIERLAGGPVSYAAGYGAGGEGPAESAEAAGLRQAAAAVAAEADAAVVFLGLPEAWESEGYDRDGIDLPAGQARLLEAVARVQPRTVAVLAHGGVVRLAEVEPHAAAILDGALLGQAGGGAIADVLFGAVNPSGRLAETVPVRIEDVPSHDDFPGEFSHVRYGEGLFVGYRWYDRRKLAVQYPFGHGLSYTSFAYSDLSAEADEDGVAVAVRIENTGRRAGREVVQVYAALAASAVLRPVQELKAFASVALEPGEKRLVRLRIDRSDLAYWNPAREAWVVEGGVYELRVGASSRDIRGSVSLEVTGDAVNPTLDLDSSLAEVLANPVAAEALGQTLAARLGGTGGGEDDLGMDLARMAAEIPIGRMVRLFGLGIGAEALGDLLEAANRASRTGPDGIGQGG
ncbi:MAG: glycoside hydrolase family 3 C-terminal domain-containing protein [Bifidobacteriaceae bacterium]|jgi:beta-glucosidase|nr:glycoside hydrolase family 3 C-terminal domain-containing protein [Bifidobacteriaceae bacterium]